MTDIEQKLAQFRLVIAEQTKLIGELRAENERLQKIVDQNADAMVCLQMIYTDPSIKPEVRAAAAKAVLPFQQPRISISANIGFLAQRLDDANGVRRAKLIAQGPLVDASPAAEEHRPNPQASDLRP